MNKIFDYIKNNKAIVGNFSVLDKLHNKLDQISNQSMLNILKKLMVSDTENINLKSLKDAF